ncbi:uncharacterized protein METZ01_LOCUS464500, partial [marine metagenome]
FLSIILFLPFIRLGTELSERLIHTAQLDGINTMIKRLAYELVPFHNYNAEDFSEGIWDISATSGVFLLTLTAGLLVKRQVTHVLIIAPIVVLLTFFIKIALVPAISALAFIKLLASSRTFRLDQIFWYLIASGGAIVLILYLFGTFDAIDNSTTLLAFNKIRKILTWRYLAEIYAVTGISVLFFLLLFDSPPTQRNTNGALLVVGGLALVYACFIAATIVDVWGVGSIITVSWIGIPLICIALMTITEN